MALTETIAAVEAYDVLGRSAGPTASKSYLVRAEHFAVPGLVVRLCRTRERADQIAAELVQIMCRDAELSMLPVEASNWQTCLAVLRSKVDGDREYYVEIDELCFEEDKP